MSDVVRIMCPNLKCRAVLGVPTAARGRMVRCKHCGSSIKIPEKREGVVPPPAADDKPAEAEKKAA